MGLNEMMNSAINMKFDEMLKEFTQVEGNNERPGRASQNKYSSRDFRAIFEREIDEAKLFEFLKSLLGIIIFLTLEITEGNDEDIDSSRRKFENIVQIIEELSRKFVKLGKNHVAQMLNLLLPKLKSIKRVIDTYKNDQGIEFEIFKLCHEIENVLTK